MRGILSGTFRRVLARSGYDIRRIDSAVQQKQYYNIYQYTKADGSFDYEKYRQVQIEGNKQKATKVWALEENIVFLSRYIEGVVGSPKFGLCHGTRRGLEQAWFKKHLQCDVLGTEISDTAKDFPDTIQWDFHEVKSEWVNSVDFIYSNAFDHSYDPQKCLNAWMSCVRPGGLCILEHSSGHAADTATQLDPFGADLVVMPYLILTWAKGKYGIREILEAPKKSEKVQYLFFLVIQKW
jgi:hypothetical protein